MISVDFIEVRAATPCFIEVRAATPCFIEVRAATPCFSISMSLFKCLLTYIWNLTPVNFIMKPSVFRYDIVRLNNDFSSFLIQFINRLLGNLFLKSEYPFYVSIKSFVCVEVSEYYKILLNYMFVLDYIWFMILHDNFWISSLTLTFISFKVISSLFNLFLLTPIFP